MILYTTIPYEMVFPYEQTASSQMVIDIDSGHLVVEQVSNHEFKVVRLISSDPFAYLNDNYTPGKMISLF